ncbi:MAG TPA: PAS domain S-box protein [Dongiaceae bacterium]
MVKASNLVSTSGIRYVCLGAALLINVGVIGVGFFDGQRVHYLSEWTEHTRKVYDLLHETQNLLIDAETGLRGYTISKEPFFTIAYDRAVTRVPQAVGEIRKLTADNVAQQANIDRAEPLIELELTRLGQWRSVIDSNRADLATMASYAHQEAAQMDLVRQSIGTMVTIEGQLYADRLAAANAATSQSQLFLMLGSALSVSLIVVTFTLMQREMLARRRSEENLTVTMNSIGDGVITTDSKGRVTRLNPVAEQMTGWSAAEAQGRPIDEIFQIINERSRQPAVIPVSAVLATGKIVGLANHTVLIARDGHELAIADSCAPIRGTAERPLGTVLVFRDVTEDRRAEAAIRDLTESLEQRVNERTAALRESEERFTAFMDASPFLAWVKDDAGRYQYMNKTCSEGLGFHDDSWIGKTVFDVAAPDTAKESHRSDQEALRTGKPVESTDHSGHLGGKEFHWRSIKIPFQSASGQRLVGGVAIDITRQAQAENQLRQAQKMEAVGQLTGGLAHDFNNLLAIIIGNLDFVIAKLHDDATRTAADEALVAALRGAELTRQLLSFSRQQSLQPRQLTVNPLVADTAKLLRRTLGESVGIKLALADNLWSVMADPSLLESALMNLAVNARDAMAGRGTLVIKTENCHLDEDYVAINPDVLVGDYVRLSVSDTGSGMTPDVISRAFDPFFTTKAVGKGTGLGLSMVHGFVKQSGGNVKIYSELGHGTTISLYLPRVIAAGETKENAQPPTLKGGIGESILVVEDNPAVLKLVEKQLGELGYNVLLASDGPSAMSVLANGQEIDLLFTDVVMAGGMSGPDLAREARKLRPNLKVLFSSGFPRDAAKDIGPDLDDMLLSKPYRRAELASKVREVLNAAG